MVQVTIQSLLTLAIGLLLVVGIIVAVSAVKQNQYSYACGTASHTGNSSRVNCYTHFTSNSVVYREIVATVDNLTIMMLGKSGLKDVTCIITEAVNESNDMIIPVSNYTSPIACSIRETTPANVLFNNYDWQVNYTYSFTNSSTSTYSPSLNAAYNLTRNVEVMTQNFSDQLGTVGVMFGIGLIITAIAVLGVGILNKKE